MRLNKQCVVVIPIHKEIPTKSEIISFNQCFKIIKNNPIILIIPKGLSLNKYISKEKKFDVIEINPKWQSSIQMYNKLKLSDFFYNLFIEYEYLLTYELDAFIFKDEIEYWCSKNIDYIGAPWFKGYINPNEKEIIGVGNSGFSLRKILSMKNALKSIEFKESEHIEISKRRKGINYLKKPINYFLKLFSNYNSIQNSVHFNEDWFISVIIPKYIKDFKIASIEDAIKFSFEVNPRLLYEMNNQSLPMGCHAWEKYDFEFWKTEINKFGHNI